MLDRIRFLRHRAEEFRPILLSAWLFSPNRAARQKCLHLMKRHRRSVRTAFGSGRDRGIPAERDRDGRIPPAPAEPGDGQGNRDPSTVITPP